jgi:perosamine synthetase
MTTHTTLDRPEASKLALRGGTPVSSDMIQIVSVRLDEADIEAALGVMRSGMLAQGANVAGLEESFAAMSDARHAVACANGTCALQLAYEPLIKPGDDVLVPAWTYIATASIVVARGANPVWVDVDPETYTIDVADAAAKVTPRTTAIACTHLYGGPVDIAAVEKLAVDRGLSVIYDAAQAHAARYDGKGVGAYGDMATYSFYPTKNMTTGEGGMVTTNDEGLDTVLRALRSHGESEKYVHSSIGYNYRMSDIEGAIGRSQLSRIDELTRRRRVNAASLDRALAGVEGLGAPTAVDRGEHVYHQYAVRVDPDAFVTPDDGRPVRDWIIEALRAEGVACALHYPRSLTRQPVFDRPGVDHQPVSDRLAHTLFCVPVHQNLTDDQVARVGEALAKVAEAFRA